MNKNFRDGDCLIRILIIQFAVSVMLGNVLVVLTPVLSKHVIELANLPKVSLSLQNLISARIDID